MNRYCIRLSVFFGLVVSLGLAGAAVSRADEENKTIRAAFRSYPPGMALCCNSLDGPRGAEEGLKGKWLGEDEIDFVLKGPWREIVSEAMRRLDRKVMWQAQHFGESIQFLKAGALDLLPRVFWSEERERFAWFVGPIESEELQVFFLIDKTKLGDITRIEDLYGLRLANEEKALTTEAIDANERFKILRFPSRREALEAVSVGQADVLIDSNLNRLLNIKKQTRAANLELASYTYRYSRPSYLALSKSTSSSAEAMELDLTVETMFEDGTVSLIFQGYGLPSPVYRSDLSRLRYKKISKKP
ncbi:MAG: hypothetical protein EBT18_03465 [Gammaproteobacteria bacterium]|nr:hypothetical protein [Gammaproteobacteria bacterium]